MNRRLAAIPETLRTWLHGMLWRLQQRVAPPPDTAAAAEPECRACAENTNPIGAGDQDVRVIAFGGGGYDAVMQLGIVHALVVADAVPPDLVIGLSVGAANAATLAEVMQADAGLRRENHAPALLREARMSRFREFLYEAQQLPWRVREMFLPDTHEADAGMALEPHHQAIYSAEERRARQEAMRSRSGLVEFLNTISRLRLTGASLARYVRCYLGLRATASLRLKDRIVERAREVSRILRTAIAHAPSTIQTIFVIGRASVRRRIARRRGYPAGDILFRTTRTLRVMQAFAIALVLMGSVRTLFRPLDDWLVVILEAAALTVLVFALPTIRHFLTGTVIVVALTATWGRTRRALARFIRDRFLEHYDLLRDLGGTYFIRDALIRLFDRTYYGDPRIATVARTVAQGGGKGVPQPAPKKRILREYTSTVPRIHVVPVAANLASGELAPIPESTPIVDALAAAMAVVPLVQPVQLGGEHYIDGSAIATEPTTAVRQLLRDRVDPEATAVHLYTVSALPIEKGQVPPRRPRRYAGLIDVLLRVQQLQRFRHTRLERAIMAVYDGALPPRRVKPERKADGKIRALKCFGGGRHMVRTTVVPIEPADHAVTLSEDLFRARTRNEQQDAVAAAVATGCRIMMETLLRPEIAAAATKGTAACGAVIGNRRGTADAGLPGASEICARCSFVTAEGERHEKTLRAVVEPAPVWPADPHLVPRKAQAIAPAPSPPPETAPLEDIVAPPTVSLLFSGGVFRGVFLVGVVNALHVFGIRPQLVAGSSVGSITAAMAARLFTLPDTQSQRHHLGLVAATYLSLDQILITDRFADFVRRLALRGAEANFSIADLDDVLRNYDRPSNARWLRAMRRIAGGFEHLLYVSPFDLLALVRALRLRNTRRAYWLLRRYFQELLDRGGVSLEVLGTEPLAYLIREHVLTEAQQKQHTVPFDTFGADGLSFFVTATNLTAGRLETIGAPDADGNKRPATLIDALLASSAFPGVFRPRWGWEVFVDENVEHQLVDGGVMDNLPLDAVVDHLLREAAAGRVAVRPENNVPHLIFTASLERDPRAPEGKALQQLSERWPAALQHARELRYNRKINTFANAQTEFRDIYRRYRDELVELPRVPLDIEAVVVKPRWLCGTFAMHPMLGFTRKRQAASIAHGCASTLQTIAAMDVPSSDSRRWLDEWHFAADVRETLDRESLGDLVPQRKTDGTCHFRTSGSCPFSPAETADRFPGAVSRELSAIYDLCGRQATHQGAP